MAPTSKIDGRPIDPARPSRPIGRSGWNVWVTMETRYKHGRPRTVERTKKAAAAIWLGVSLTKLHLYTRALIVAHVGVVVKTKGQGIGPRTFCPWFHLPGQPILGYLVLTHRHVGLMHRLAIVGKWRFPKVGNPSQLTLSVQNNLFGDGISQV